MLGWLCNYWMVAICLKISLTKLLMKILMSGWTCKVLDGGDRRVTYGIVSGWALLCWRYLCQDGCHGVINWMVVIDM